MCWLCYIFLIKRNRGCTIQNLLDFNRFIIMFIRSFYSTLCQIEFKRSFRARHKASPCRFIRRVDMFLAVINPNLAAWSKCTATDFRYCTLYLQSNVNIRTLHHISYDMRIIFNQFFYHIFIFRSRVLFQLRFYRITIDSQFRRITYIRFQLNHHFTLIRNAFCLSIILNVDCLLLFLSNNGNRIHFTVYIRFGRYRQ